MDVQTFEKSLLRFYDRMPYVLGFVMGMLLIFYGSAMLYAGTVSETLTILRGASGLLSIFSGLMIVLFFRRDTVRTVGLYAVALGFSRIVIRYEAMETIGNPVMLAIQFLLLLLAVNLVYTGLSFSVGRVVRRISLMVTTVILSLWELIAALGLGDTDSIIGIAIGGPVGHLIVAAMYWVLVIMLDSKQMYYGSQEGVHAIKLDRIRRSYRMDEESFITPEVAQSLMSRSGPLWKGINDGFVEKEMTFLINQRVSEATVVAQVLSGQDALYLTILADSGSVVFANRKKVDCITMSNEQIHMYGKDGTDFTLKVQKGAIV